MPMKGKKTDEKKLQKKVQPDYQKIITAPFEFMAKDPKIFAVGMLNWIPALAIALVFADFISKHGTLASQWMSITKGASDPQAISAFFKAALPAMLAYLPALVLIGMFWVLIYELISLIFAHLVGQRRGIFKTGGISLNLAFNGGLSKLVTGIIAGLLLCFAFLAAVIALVLSILVAALIGKLFAPLGVLVGLALFLAWLAIFIGLIIAAVVLDSAIVIKGLGVVDSIRDSAIFARKNIFFGLAMLLVICIIGYIINLFVALIGNIPAIGIALTFLGGLISTAYGGLSAAELYCELNLLGKTKKE
jgi:hypothetical protein